MADQSYKVEVVDNSPRILRNDGEAISVDYSSQAFCDFLTWASLQAEPQPHFGRLPRGFYFTDRTRLVEKCKELSVLLHACADPLYLPTSGRKRHGGVDFESLGRVVANYLSPSSPIPEVLPVNYGQLWVTDALLTILKNQLADEASEIRKLSAIPVTKSFVYLDVSDFSTYDPIEQTLIVNSINQLSSEAPRVAMVNVAEAFQDIEARLCIGDGYIYCFTNPMFATFFAGMLASKIEVAVARGEVPVEFHFRMGIHTGPVYHFWDPGRNDWNYVGDGINGGSRVLEAIGKGADDLVFMSSAVRGHILASRESEIPYREIRKSLINRGRRDDKHGNKWRVYEFNHSQFAEQLRLA